MKEGEDLEEHKNTDHGSYRLTVEEWKKIREQALLSGREPRMTITFRNEGVRLMVREF